MKPHIFKVGPNLWLCDFAGIDGWSRIRAFTSWKQAIDFASATQTVQQVSELPSVPSTPTRVEREQVTQTTRQLEIPGTGRTFTGSRNLSYMW